MSDQFSSSDKSEKTNPIRAVLLPLAVIVSLLVILLLARSVINDLRELRSAKSDTVQWTLSQVEIEYLDFSLTLREAIDTETPNLALLRKDFDIFFSRHDIVSNGVVFADVRLDNSFNDALEEIRVFLQSSAEVIDADDADLIAGLPNLQTETDALRPVVRSLYVSGLSHFADASDQLRERLASTLRTLSAVTAVLVVSLVALMLYSRAADANSRARGKALARANAHMNTILSTSLDGVIVSDKTGHVLDFNAASETIFGYSFVEAVGQPLGDLIVPPALRDAHNAGMKRMIETGEKKLVGKGRIRIEAMRKDGSLFPVELALQSGQGPDGDILIAFLRDISAQVAAEEELTEARDQALAGEKAKAEFLTVMSHEIRTPLSGLLGNLSLLGGTDLTGEQHQFQNNMEISGRQLLKHVNSILDIARFESGRLPIREENFHIGEFLQEIVDSQSGGAEQRNSAMSWAWVGPPLTWVKNDKGHFEQILLNLVGNAVKFTQNGRIDIELEQIGQRGASPLLEVRVIDTGIGIPEKDLERIFKEFETTKRAGGDTGSTGLGLPIAKRLVTLMGGDIGVESTPGEGSAFWIRLPMPEGYEVLPDMPEEPNLPHAPLHLLLVEDNEMNAFVVEKMLRAEGHTVVLATNGLEAIQWAKKADFDGILMDINMPKLDGLEATKQIRADVKRANKTPIFAFSANVLPADTQRFRESGMDGFIGKPVQIEELRAALSAIAEQSAALSLHASPAAAPKPAPTNPARDMLGDKYDMFRERFLTEGDALIALLNGEKIDDTEVRDLCHKMVSTANIFGVSRFQHALQETETLVKSGHPLSSNAIDAIKSTWAEARQTLQS